MEMGYRDMNDAANAMFSHWLRAQARGSYKPEEAVVTIAAREIPESAVGFFVDKNLVDVAGGSLDESNDIPAKVRVMLIERRNGSAVVEVPGEPISLGPKSSSQPMILE